MTFRHVRGNDPTFMSEVAFLDANVRFYRYDRGDERKRHIASALFRFRLQNRTLVISTQVVQEFHVSVTRKFGLGRRDARQLVADLCELPLIVVTPQEILRALQLETQHMVSFWDALILSAAETAGAQVVLSEDFTHDRTYGALRVVNPFLT